MTEAVCRRLFQQLMVAVDYCHRLGIANRDIKVSMTCCRAVLQAQERAAVQRRSSLAYMPDCSIIS